MWTSSWQARAIEHSEVLRRVAQAISESLSGINSSKEKDWIDGFFTGLNTPKDSIPDQTILISMPFS